MEGKEYSVEEVLKLAIKLHKDGKVTPAENIYNKVLEVEPNNFNALHLLGVAKQQKRQPELGAKLILKALEIKPDFAEACYSLGLLYKEEGNKEKSVEYESRAIELKPAHTEAHHVLSSMIQYDSADHPHIKQMEELLNSPDIEEQYKLYLYFSLSKAYNDFKDFKQSFEYLKEGSRIKRAGFEYDIKDDIKKFNDIKSIFSKEYFEKNKNVGFKDESMIFIIGMPRSGTSLVDQILSSHKLIEGVGELDTMKHIINSREYPYNFENYSGHIFEELGYNFIQAINTIGVKEPKIIDKMPDNFRLLGVLQLLLPRSKIIHCKRNPIDTCLSIYTNHFNGIQNFSYDQVELGTYYKLYQDLMEHWKQVMPYPENFIEVQYEDVVADQEGQSRRLLDFLGMPWDDKCLEFYKTERSVKTASADQVRKPIYTSSVEKWKQYEELLQPLIKTLES